MKPIDNLVKWFDENNSLAYSFIRIFLGIALFVRGIILSSDPQTITQWVGANQWYWWYSYIIVIHIIGGVLLAIGLVSRLAAFLQIPVLIGAVFFIHLKQGLMRVEQSLELSVLVLILLVIFFLFGSGDLALDKYIAKRKR